MKRLKLGVLALFALAFTAAQAQTADEIVSKHIAAIGGKEKIGAIKTLYIESNASVMGNDAPATTTVMNGKGFKSEMDFGGQKIVQTVTDQGGWMINPFAGGTDAQAMPEEQYKAAKEEINIGGPLYDYAAKGNKIELAGRENVGNVSAYKLKVTTKDNATSTYYIDPNTYYILKTVRTVNMGGQEGEIAITFSDYKKTDYGYVLPYSMETTLPQGMTMSSTVKKVEINKDVDPKIFVMPK